MRVQVTRGTPRELSGASSRDASEVDSTVAVAGVGSASDSREVSEVAPTVAVTSIGVFQ